MSVLHIKDGRLKAASLNSRIPQSATGLSKRSSLWAKSSTDVTLAASSWRRPCSQGKGSSLSTI